MSERPIQLAVLVSGSGTTLQNLLDEIAAGRLDARVAVVIGSKPGLLGIERAKRVGIATHVVDRHSDSFSRSIFDIIAAANVDLVCLAGWLCLLEIPNEYAGKVMNIHPSLLPSFGGRGMFGQRVHAAVLDRGCKISGCTVHFVDAEYDSGPIILQRACPVLDDDTPELLAQRVFEEEKIAYPEAIRLFAKGVLHIDGQRVFNGGK